MGIVERIINEPASRLIATMDRGGAATQRKYNTIEEFAPPRKILDDHHPRPILSSLPWNGLKKGS
jgi:hypothetical protein